MSAYEANVESGEDVDLAEALDLCLDPDCIGTARVTHSIFKQIMRKKNRKREREREKQKTKTFT